MKHLLNDVLDFHRACDIPIASDLSVPGQARADLRIELIEEEVNRELLPAMRAGDLIEIADAMADSIYVIVGAAIEYGIPLDHVWAAVQGANMAQGRSYHWQSQATRGWKDFEARWVATAGHPCRA